MQAAMEPFLNSSDVIDWRHPAVRAKAGELAQRSSDVRDIARRCFEWVRDTIQHSYDYKRNPVTCSASEVLLAGTGYCYAKVTFWQPCCAPMESLRDFATSA